jgi:hypothetical protein
MIRALCFVASFLIVLAFNVASLNGQDAAADWVRITPDQVPEAAVMELKDLNGLRREECREAVWESTGSDRIAESQFTIFVIAVVNRTGHIQRFRIVRNPLNVDLAPVRNALAAWRFTIPEAARSSDAFQITIVIPKDFGATSSACETAKPAK